MLVRVPFEDNRPLAEDVTVRHRHIAPQYSLQQGDPLHFYSFEDPYFRRHGFVAEGSAITENRYHTQDFRNFIDSIRSRMMYGWREDHVNPDPETSAIGKGPVEITLASSLPRACVDEALGYFDERKRWREAEGLELDVRQEDLDYTRLPYTFLGGFLGYLDGVAPEISVSRASPGIYKAEFKAPNKKISHRATINGFSRSGHSARRLFRPDKILGLTAGRPFLVSFDGVQDGVQGEILGQLAQYAENTGSDVLYASR